jgi:hypothetical protein
VRDLVGQQQLPRLAHGGVGERAHHAAGMALAVAQALSARQHPALARLAPAQAVLVLEAVRAARDVGGQLRLHGGAVVGVDALQPVLQPLGEVGRLAPGVDPGQQGAGRLRELDAAGEDVEVPDPVAAAGQGQRVGAGLVVAVAWDVAHGAFVRETLRLHAGAVNAGRRVLTSAGTASWRPC